MYGQWTHLQLNSFSLFDVFCCCKNTNCKSHRPNSIAHVFCNSWRFCTFMFPLLRVLSAFLCRRTAVHYLQAPASLSRRNRQKTARLWIHRPQLARWRSSPFSRISNPKASFWLEKADVDPAIPGYVQLRRIWSHWISASRLHGRRQPVVRPDDQWWTWQRSRRVCHEKKIKAPFRHHEDLIIIIIIITIIIYEFIRRAMSTRRLNLRRQQSLGGDDGTVEWKAKGTETFWGNTVNFFIKHLPVLVYLLMTYLHVGACLCANIIVDQCKLWCCVWHDPTGKP